MSEATSDYVSIEEGQVVFYSPMAVTRSVQQGGGALDALFQSKGFDPVTQYVVQKASEPRSRGGITGQTVTVLVHGKSLDLRSDFFYVCERSEHWGLNPRPLGRLF
jgi:hypothetical protein|tara:strand:+ start:398 stop:715 length:318 start_codon:yes stop_codon:yes gene_type:complete